MSILAQVNVGPRNNWSINQNTVGWAFAHLAIL